MRIIVRHWYIGTLCGKTGETNGTLARSQIDLFCFQETSK